MPTNSSDSLESYLLVLGEGSARKVPLPLEGQVVIGRSEDADVQVSDASVASHHVSLVTDSGGTFVVPMEGETLLDDEVVQERRSIRPGDTLKLGAVTVGLHGRPSRDKGRATLNAEQMRQRLLEECERFLRYRRSFAFMLIRARADGEDLTETMLRAAIRAVRVVDVVAWGGHHEVWVLFPETARSAMIPATRVLDAVLSVVPEASASLARCPIDGIQGDALLAGARYVARRAPPGQVVPLSEAPHDVDVGDTAVVVVDPVMRSLFELVRRLATSEIPVLVTGETGAGKEAVARAVHAWSKRSKGKLVSVNCAAMAETLLESELFGHEKGAFTGATSSKAGLFEEASGGTVFLDEIGECSPKTQAELLRVLETKRYCRVGSLKERTTDVRIVAATNRSLEAEIEAGRFRRDLYFRLNAATVVVPPLRDRPLDLLPLAQAFLRDACERDGRELLELSQEAMTRLALHTWPGNVRELRNTIAYLVATASSDCIQAEDLPPAVAADTAPWLLPKQDPAPAHRPPSFTDDVPVATQEFRNLYDEIRELEKLRIQQALDAAGGVRNKAAELIGMPLRTLVTKIKVYELGPAPARGRRKG